MERTEQPNARPVITLPNLRTFSLSLSLNVQNQEHRDAGLHVRPSQLAASLRDWCAMGSNWPSKPVAHFCPRMIFHSKGGGLNVWPYPGRGPRTLGCPMVTGTWDEPLMWLSTP